EFSMAITAAPMAAALLADYPEVEKVTRLSGGRGFPVIRYGDKVFSEERWASADSTFSDIFRLSYLLGDPKTALSKPNQVVLTETTAKRYFGAENPIGKLLNSDRRRDFMVAGVIEDFPRTNHFHVDFLASAVSYEGSESPHWINHNSYTYLVLREGTDPDEFEAKLPEMVTKYVGPQIEQAMGVSWDNIQEEGGAAFGFHLQPLTDIHLRSHLDEEIEANGSATTISIFGVIALFILVLAIINYMNLATARSAKRAKEVGVRKTLGSHQGPLVRQFLAESVVFTVIAAMIAVVLIKLSLPWFNNFVGLQLGFSLAILPILLAASIVVGLLAGSYPAFFLSSFDPAEVLRGSKTAMGKGSKLRGGLVIFQFTISIVLFSGALLVKRQLNYMQNKPLGFDKTDLLVVEKTDDIGADIQAFMTQLRANPRIKQVSNSTAIPGRVNEYGSSVFGIATDTGREMRLLNVSFVDFQFAEVYGIKMASGRFFDPNFSTDSNAVILNQAAARTYGIEDPVGLDLQVFTAPNTPSVDMRIIGVMDDYHFEPLHQDIRPMMVFPIGATVWGGRRNFGKFVTAKVEPQNIGATLGSLETIWKGFADDQTLEYVFLDDDLDALYATDARTQSIMSLFTALAIFIASLGLLGLAAFAAEQRTKEVGIRKVLGATVSQIFVILSRDMLTLVLVAVGLALPASYVLLSRWLEDFAYRISYSPSSFAVAGFVALLVALATISYQVLRASVADPVNSLRYE
ncbi:MAG: FtsX-like permease family protein, partial [Candidatus Neomarinimicrobiota bacterium]